MYVMQAHNVAFFIAAIRQHIWIYAYVHIIEHVYPLYREQYSTERYTII